MRSSVVCCVCSSLALVSSAAADPLLVLSCGQLLSHNSTLISVDGELAHFNMYKGSEEMHQDESETYGNALLSPVTFDGQLSSTMKISYEGYEDQPDVAGVDYVTDATGGVKGQRISFFRKTVSPCGVLEDCGNVMKFVSDSSSTWYSLDTMDLTHGSGNATDADDDSYQVTTNGVMYPGPVHDVQFIWGRCKVDIANLSLLEQDLQRQRESVM
jgi:hypothetical protein